MTAGSHDDIDCKPEFLHGRVPHWTVWSGFDLIGYDITYTPRGASEPL